MRLRLLAPALVLAGLPLPALASAAGHAPVDARLLHLDRPSAVFVVGTSLSAAERAAHRAGMTVVERYAKVGIVVATAPPGSPARAARQPGVTYVEDADVPLALTDEYGDRATHNDDARTEVQPRMTGAGIGVAVIDSGIDGTHPFLQAQGSSKVVASYKELCTDLADLAANPPAACWVADPTNDSDTLSAGGHGTHVAGIIAGEPTTVTPSAGGEQRTISGVAPAVRLVSLSVGENAKINSGTSGMNWVLEHHDAPCGPDVPASTCPPIRVVNNSWGPVGGSQFLAVSAEAQIQRALVREGVVTVWAAGNDGGNGSGKDSTNGVQDQRTNGPGNDPTPGILMVGAYDGRNNDGQVAVADFSSRGTKGKPDTYPDLVAPGTLVLSSCRPWLEVCSEGLDPYDGPGAPGGFNVLSGTSMATPYVTGVVAELLGRDPRLTPAEVETALENGAYRFGTGYEPDPTNPGSPTSFDRGHGLVDVVASARVAHHVAVGKLPPPPPAYQQEVFVDPEGDATQAPLGTQTPVNHPAADLRAGGWVRKGGTLTLVFLMTDLDPSHRGPGESGTTVRAYVTFGSSRTVVIDGGAGYGSDAYAADGSASNPLTTPLHEEVVDRPGTGADEIRISMTDSDLAPLGLNLPPIAAGLKLTPGSIGAAYSVPAGLSVGDTDTAVGRAVVLR